MSNVKTNIENQRSEERHNKHNLKIHGHKQANQTKVFDK